MAHAWLDSLSEDWVSQPRSDSSQAHIAPPTQSDTPDRSHMNAEKPVHSRIPRLSNGLRKTRQNHSDGSISVLSERSANDINIRGSIRNPSKLSQEIKISQRGRPFSRSVSASTAGSVLHNTVQHKSQSASPGKSRDQVLEWRKRLLEGDTAYGEAKDLFTSAGNGLESMFRPPQAPDPPQMEQSGLDDHDNQQGDCTANETTLQSSPPPYNRARHNNIESHDFVDSSGGGSQAQPSDGVAAPRLRSIRYNTNDLSMGGLGVQEDSELDSEVQEQSELSDKSFGISAYSLGARPHTEPSRKISGRSYVQHEDFSPILLSRKNADDGHISFAPIELPADKLVEQLNKLRRNQMLLDSDPDAEPAVDLLVTDTTWEAETTEDYANQGGYLNLRRGGRSAEGSFRRKPLSPPLPPQTDTSEMLPESSLQASTPKQFPTIRTETFVAGGKEGSSPTPTSPASPASPEPPRAPHPSPQKHSHAPQAAMGSPLKLFGVHDTFTNKTLMRRISQFEEQMSKNSSHLADSPEEISEHESPSRTEPNQAFVAASSPVRGQQASYGHHETFGAVNQFGAGELDGHEFSAEIYVSPSERSDMSDKENLVPEGAPSPAAIPLSFDIEYNLSDAERDSLRVRRRRQTSKSMSFVPGHRRASSEKMTLEFRALTTPKRDGSDGKRPRTSPSKDPTPKRRRTLHRTDIAYDQDSYLDTIDSIRVSHHQMQFGIGRKRKDARSGDLVQVAEPSVMAIRQVLLPQTASSRRPSGQRERQPLAEVLLDVHAPSQEASPEKPNISLPGAVVEGSRKSSMNTQNIQDAATKIIAFIRSKARPNSGQASLAESDAETAEQRLSHGLADVEESYEESTQEPFSRPPSREGAPLPRWPEARQGDPEVAARLRKYQEPSDFGDLVSDSVRSVGLAQEAIQEVNQINESVQQSIRRSEMRHSSPLEDEIISDLPNVRLSRNPDALAHEEGDLLSQRSVSTGGSTRSVPTGSSRNSDSRRYIAPDAVTGLIGDQVGNMVLDREKRIWNKVKTARALPENGNILPSENSDEDPFASIADLSVNFAQEREYLALRNARLDDLEEFAEENLSATQLPPAKLGSVRPSDDGESVFAGSRDTLETFTKATRRTVESVVETDDRVEHEITIDEDRVQKTTPSRRRNLTITFSSPVASFIEDALPQSSGSFTHTEDDDSVPERSVGSIAADSLRRGRHGAGGRSASEEKAKIRSRSQSRGPTRTLSLRGREFLPRPVSRIDEQDEDTIVDYSTADQRQVSIRADTSIAAFEDEKRAASVSFVVTTPAAGRTRTHSAYSTIAEHVGTLSLSPLSEFTINHGDQSMGLEVSYVVGDDYLVTGSGSKKILSQAIRAMVEKITEVEPFEPDWDTMQELDLSRGQLRSLHKLDQFCSGVVTLDASNNAIGQLHGTPQTVRNLRITHNLLSELTAWGHLMNLQYVDISNNQLVSLHAFQDLVHLRSLRADNNQITSLDGIMFHDGLQTLRVRGNQIEEVDFDGTSMQKLTELDLEGNRIESIARLDQLTSLSSLNLQNNRLESFGVARGRKMLALRHLKLSNNLLAALDISAFTGVSLVFADRNKLSTINGCLKAPRLDSLSLREQQGDALLDLGFLSEAYEVRKLFLSGNLLGSFDPPIDFLNLQYLELANCGLQSLSANIGQMMPNLRTLNLNFNAIAELAPLQYIPRLKKLLVAGNRLDDTRAVAGVMSEFAHLKKADLRDNPITLGFYPPFSSSQASQDQQQGASRELEPFILPEVGVERDAKFRGRLDLGTRKRRRVYELVLAARCGRLGFLDGLALDRARVHERDGVWNALKECGAIEDLATRSCEEAPAKEEEEEEEEL